MTEELFEREIKFIQQLKNASKADLAILKRASGSSLSEARPALGVFYKYLPYTLNSSFYEEVYFIVASLYPLNDHKFTGNFGKTMNLVKRKRGESESIDRRFNRLLNCKLDIQYGGLLSNELAFKLQQCVKLACSQEVGIDWVQLLYDLRYWNHPDKFVQKQWAKSYFITQEKGEN